jgi:2-polyprenyl-3-methyl-5-hydroxy-6-metoxy-1,4-benzoquinol methylase
MHRNTNMRQSKTTPIPTRAESFAVSEHVKNTIIPVVQVIRNAEKNIPSWFDYYQRNHSIRIAFDFEMIKESVAKDSTLLEIGSSPLILTGALKTQGYKVTGLDIDPSRFGRAAQQLELEIVKCDVETENLPFADNSFEVVIFNEVFEHLRINPIHTFKEVGRVLRSGGLLFLSTPNGRSFANLSNLIMHDRGLDVTIYDAYIGIEEHGHMGHVREYTVTDVTEFLEKMGFDCMKVVYRGRYPTNLGQLFARSIPSLRPFFSVIAQKPTDSP